MSDNDLGIGVADISSKWGLVSPVNRVFLWLTPNRCSSSMMANASLGISTDSCMREWVPIIRSISPDFIASNQNLDHATIGSIQKIYDSLDSLVFTIKDTSRNQKEIYHFIQSLTEQIRELNKLNREQEKKLSNFLSTQLNTQLNILELSSKLSKEGLMDKKTKLHLQNIDKGIKLLITKIKK